MRSNTTRAASQVSAVTSAGTGNVTISPSLCAARRFWRAWYPAGVLATGIGLTVLASEYPEAFEKIRQSLPEYFDRSMRVMEMAARAGRRITESAGRGAIDAWEDISG